MHDLFHVYYCPPELWRLVGDYELSQCNLLNRSLYHETRTELMQRRAEKAQEVLNFFYIPSFSLFSTNKGLHSDIEYYARVLFRILPELFIFLHEHEVHYIDFSMIYSTSKKSYINLLSLDELRDMADLVFYYVKHHHYIQYFQYALFKPILTTEMVNDIIDHHPILKICAMRRQATKPSTVLYAYRSI